jgi:hypothetical protein
MIEEEKLQKKLVSSSGTATPQYLYLRLRLGREGAAAGADSFSGSTALFLPFPLVVVAMGGIARLFVTGVRGISISPSVRGLPGVIGLVAACGKAPVWGGVEGQGGARHGAVVDPLLSEDALGSESTGTEGCSDEDACVAVMRDCIWARSLSMMLAGRLVLDALEASASFFTLECARPLSLPNISLKVFKSSLKVKEACMIPTCSSISINHPSIRYQLRRG